MRVHHIELLCKDLKLQVQHFCNRFGFSVHGIWRDRLANKEKLVLKKSDIFFVLHQEKDLICDSIDNVALEVENPRNLCKKLDKSMVHVLPSLLSSENGEWPKLCQQGEDVSEPGGSSVEAAIIKSPIGNIKHTIIDKRNFTGMFLPNFLPSRTLKDLSVDGVCISSDSLDESSQSDKCCSGLDHITFAVQRGTSLQMMDWYKEFLGFSRCRVNQNEGKDGFVVSTSTEYGAKLSLKLTAMQYHFCSEEMMKLPQSSSSLSSSVQENNVKFVVGESLHDQGPNQIDTFLKENGGPGIQHIGLSTSNIFESVGVWRKNKVQFINPPSQYYNEIAESIRRISVKGLHGLLEDHSVLLDIEDSAKEEGSSEKYLLQVFTKPIFDRQTFFFELIQRQGATGFGAGNISALWRAVEAYLRETSEPS